MLPFQGDLDRLTELWMSDRLVQPQAADPERCELSGWRCDPTALWAGADPLVLAAAAVGPLCTSIGSYGTL